ncbi:MAG: hypothetical protein GY928_06485 [Colwellia sp.]|nr:hypothetical protein [Colwellia sp.]
MKLLTKTGIEVSIVSESENTILVQEVQSCGWYENGDPMFQQLVVSKKRHKGFLLLDGTAIC